VCVHRGEYIRACESMHCNKCLTVSSYDTEDNTLYFHINFGLQGYLGEMVRITPLQRHQKKTLVLAVIHTQVSCIFWQ
jgi:hypothetical protein